MYTQRGHMTLPVEAGQESVVADLFERWQADALRDSDGTSMPDTLAQGDHDVYAIMCLVRADQDFANAHPEYLHRKYLMSFPVTAQDRQLTIIPLDGYSKDKYELDEISDPQTWWEVRDRTAGCVVPPSHWHYDPQTRQVHLIQTTPYHEYTVSFLAKQIWDSVSMYNALTNDWQGPRIKSVDPYHSQVRAHLKNYFANWLKTHPDTTVVRFTTFAYLFVIDSGENNQDIYRDWTGYGETVSPQALTEFKKQFGYALTPEDFVDAGYYNGTYKVPSNRYKDWMTFVQNVVVDFASELCDMAHQAGKRTAMFQGDHWIGTEPFLPCYEKIGIDINIGAVEDGVALRRLTDSPGEHVREARFYPYFFPDVFKPGNDPVAESMKNWTKIRRAMLRKPLDRIGYGGYLSLANQFPDFIDHVTEISKQFGEYLEMTRRTPSIKVPGKIAILNAWGQPRAWLQQQVRDQRFYIPPRPDVMELVGSNPLECLAGLPFDIQFISFDDILNHGIDPDVKAIINMGDANTAWSGGDCWADPQVIVKLREFVGNGGGLLGIGEPSAYQSDGRYFQLGDIFGLEKETSLTMGRVASPIQKNTEHYLYAFVTQDIDLGNPSYVYPQSQTLDVIAAHGQHIALSANQYGDGRSVYISSLPFSMHNAWLLEHVLIWLLKQEQVHLPFVSDNPMVDLACYPQTNHLAMTNSSDQVQTVKFLDEKGKKRQEQLQAYAWKWLSIG